MSRISNPFILGWAPGLHPESVVSIMPSISRQAGASISNGNRDYNTPSGEARSSSLSKTFVFRGY